MARGLVPLVASVGVLLVAVVCGVGVVVLGRDSDESLSSDPSSPLSSSFAPPVSPSVSPSVPVVGSVCGLESVGVSGLVDEGLVVPGDWWGFQGLTTVPSVPGAGPGRVVDGVSSCFAWSDVGVVLAALWLSALSWDSGVDASVVWGTYLSVGEFRESLLESFVRASESSPSGVSYSLAGFRLLEFSGATARVDVCFRGSLPGSGVQVWFSRVYRLVWDGDWRLDASVPLTESLSQVQVSGPVGYLPVSVGG